MNKFITLIMLALVFFVLNCQMEQQKENEQITSQLEEEAISGKSGNKQEKTKKVSDIANYKQVIEKIPLLDSATISDKKLNYKLVEYASKLFNTDAIKTEQDVKNIFVMRTDLMKPLLPALEKTFDAYGYDKKWELLDKELLKIGISGIYAEGMLVDIGQSKILEDKIVEVCSVPFQKYIEFENAHIGSMGGEYPYLDLSGNMKVISIGEHMKKEYPDSKYSEEITPKFNRAIKIMTDVHKLVAKDGTETYLIDGISTDFYPFATELSNFEQFIENYKESWFAPVVERIINNISTIKVNDAGKYGFLYLVVVNQENNYEIAQKHVMKYLFEGFDIPHSIKIKDGDMELYAITYRFFSEKEKAEEALASIKENFPDAKIIKIDIEGKLLK